jgi:acyl-CoA thioester hydrolase
MRFEAPLSIWGEPIQEEWVDYNGHMNVAYYSLIFNNAAHVFYPLVGLGEPYREKTGHTTFAVEMHNFFQREGSLGDPVEVTVQLLGFDEKRLHFFETMLHAKEGYQMATMEVLAIHVDLSGPKAVPLPGEPRNLLTELMESHKDLPVPPQVGSVIKVGSKKAGS